MQKKRPGLVEDQLQGLTYPLEYLCIYSYACLITSYMISTSTARRMIMPRSVLQETADN